MRLTLRQLQIFTAVADSGSTTAAGQQVALSQSAVSGALGELEALLEARLFDRVGKRLVLNDAGRGLLPQARALLDGAAGIESQFSQGAAAPLRVGASTTIGNYLLPALVASHLREAPGSTIDVSIGNTSMVCAAVARMDVDLGLIEGPCHEAALQVRPWLEDELVLVCAPSHPMAGGHPHARIGPPALRQQRWLLREPGSGTREAVEQALLPHLHHWAQPMQLGSTEAIKQAAAQGLGLACLPRCAVQDLLTLQRLVLVHSSLPRLSRRFYLVHHRHKRFSRGLQRFVDHCEAA